MPLKEEESFDDLEDECQHSIGEGNNYINTRRVSPDSYDTRVNRKGADLSHDSRHIKPRALERYDTDKPKRKQQNPCILSHKESPVKTVAPSSPALTVPTLSRNSTFSAHSRQKSKILKQII